MRWRDARRLKEILEAFANGGFAYYFHKSKLSSCVSLKCRIKCWYQGCFCEPKKKSLPFYFRQVLEGLGPTFIKLGQMLSVRPDFIPVEYSEELRKLQDHVPIFSFSQVKKIVEAELGPLDKVFVSFEKKPVASASIAQVHKAKLKSGKVVAVKVQRPGVAAQIRQDLRLIAWTADFLEKHWEASRTYRPKRLAQEFAEWTEQELDFRHEAKFMEEVRSQLRGNSAAVIPKVYWDQTGKTVFTMQFIAGCNLYDVACLKKHKLSGKTLALHGAQIMLEQAMIHGVFHGDPHPGNLIAMTGNRIAMLDFGIVGLLPLQTRKKLLLILNHLLKQELDDAVTHVLELAELSEDANVAEYKHKLYRMFGSWYGSRQNSLTQTFFKAIAVGVEFKVYFPEELVLFAKMLVTAESVGLLLDPQFDMATRMRPFVRDVVRSEFGILKSLKRFIRNLWEQEDLFEDLPGRVAKLLHRLENDGE